MPHPGDVTVRSDHHRAQLFHEALCITSFAHTSIYSYNISNGFAVLSDILKEAVLLLEGTLIQEKERSHGLL